MKVFRKIYLACVITLVIIQVSCLNNGKQVIYDSGEITIYASPKLDKAQRDSLIGSYLHREVDKGNFYAINDYLVAIKELQITAMQQIRDTLQARLPKGYTVTRVIKGLDLDALGVENRHDYRNYIWINILKDKKEYMISSIFQDQDFETGNMHHQLGRIQFWKNFIHHSKKWCSTANRLADDGKHWIFSYENSYDPKIKLYDKDYSVENVVKEFMQFIQEDKNAL
ncbi:MAG: hypothetical protein KBS95_03800 [Alistipes sp.]|nr:hypothetical protein [Candidatus Alistipes equi]